jgi:hypothetical protein
VIWCVLYKFWLFEWTSLWQKFNTCGGDAFETQTGRRMGHVWLDGCIFGRDQTLNDLNQDYKWKDLNHTNRGYVLTDYVFSLGFRHEWIINPLHNDPRRRCIPARIQFHIGLQCNNIRSKQASDSLLHRTLAIWPSVLIVEQCTFRLKRTTASLYWITWRLPWQLGIRAVSIATDEKLTYKLHAASAILS